MAVKTVDLGKVVGQDAYTVAVEGGYKGTKERFYEDLAALSAVKDLTATAETGAPGSVAQVSKTVGADGAVALHFTVPAGEKGATGAQGPKGDNGDTGPAGAAGKSAFAAAVEAGYTGTEAEFYAALVSLKNGPFLPLAGGTIRGGDELRLVVIDPHYIELLDSDGIGVRIRYEGTLSGAPILFLGGNEGDELVILGNIAMPTANSDAANKGYVDKIAKPLMRTVTLSASGWGENTQTITVPGVLAAEGTQRIIPIPASGSQAAYIEAGIKCTRQGANSLTFTCDTVPAANLTVYVTLEEVRM